MTVTLRLAERELQDFSWLRFERRIAAVLWQCAHTLWARGLHMCLSGHAFWRVEMACLVWKERARGSHCKEQRNINLESLVSLAGRVTPMKNTWNHCCHIKDKCGCVCVCLCTIISIIISLYDCVIACVHICMWLCVCVCVYVWIVCSSVCVSLELCDITWIYVSA